MTDRPDRKKTEATLRQEALSQELGIDTYARFPRELIEFMMDRPPVNVIERQDWKPVRSLYTRVYYTYLRYSWCWPICLSYAVVTDDRDEIKYLPGSDRPILLSEQAVAVILGTTEQRVQEQVLKLTTDKRLHRETRKQGGVARVFPVAKPVLSAEERRDTSTPCLGGPVPRPVLLAFTNVFNQLGPPERLLHIPPENGDSGTQEEVSVREYSTRVLGQLAEVRTQFLKAWKEARYSERKAYSDTLTQVRNLIVQTQSSDSLIQASSSSATAGGVTDSKPEKAPEASTTSTSTAHEDSKTSTPPAAPIPKDARFYQRIREACMDAGKGLLTPRQLADAWKLMPADAEVEDLENFLLRPAGAARISRIPHAGVFLTLMGEFATTWIKGAKDRARHGEENARIHQEREAQHAQDAAAAEAKHQRLVAHPEECPWCAGKGWYSSTKLPAEVRPRSDVRMACGCPAGEKYAAAPGAQKARPPTKDAKEWADDLLGDLNKKTRGV